MVLIIIKKIPKACNETILIIIKIRSINLDRNVLFVITFKKIGETTRIFGCVLTRMGDEWAHSIFSLFKIILHKFECFSFSMLIKCTANIFITNYKYVNSTDKNFVFVIHLVKWKKESHCISCYRKLKSDNVAYFHTHNVVSHNYMH